MYFLLLDHSSCFPCVVLMLMTVVAESFHQNQVMVTTIRQNRNSLVGGFIYNAGKSITGSLSQIIFFPYYSIRWINNWIFQLKSLENFKRRFAFFSDSKLTEKIANALCFLMCRIFGLAGFCILQALKYAPLNLKCE